MQATRFVVCLCMADSKVGSVQYMYHRKKGWWYTLCVLQTTRLEACFVCISDKVGSLLFLYHIQQGCSIENNVGSM